MQTFADETNENITSSLTSKHEEQDIMGTNETFKQGLYNPFHGSAIVEEEHQTESKLAHIAFLQQDLQGESLG